VHGDLTAHSQSQHSADQSQLSACQSQHSAGQSKLPVGQSQHSGEESSTCNPGSGSTCGSGAGSSSLLSKAHKP